MSKWGNKLTKGLIIIGVPFLSILMIFSLIFYIQTWYSANQVLVVNIQNASTYLVFIISILLSGLINLALTIYYSKSLKRVEKLCDENRQLSELILKQDMKIKDEILSAIELKEGAKITAKNDITNAIYFCQNNIAEFIYNQAVREKTLDIQTTEVWEIEPLRTAKPLNTQGRYARYDDTYRCSKSIKLIKKIDTEVWMKQLEEYKSFINFIKEHTDTVMNSKEYKEMEIELESANKKRKEFENKWTNEEVTHKEYTKVFQEWNKLYKKMMHMIEEPIDKRYKEIISLNI